MSRDAAEAAFSVALARLRSPLDADDAASGWTAEGKQVWVDYLKALAARARSEHLSRHDFLLMRGLNFDGVGIGETAAAIRAVEATLSEAFASPRQRNANRDSTPAPSRSNSGSL